MLPDTIMKIENVWKPTPEKGYSTYIPSALFLLIAIDNGWEIVKVESVPSWDQLGFVYLVSLKNPAQIGSASSWLVLPKSALVEKILEEHCLRLPLPENG
jgi:hypothetical protein